MLSNIIDNSTLTVETPEIISAFYSVELRSRDLDVFYALVNKIQYHFPLVEAFISGFSTEHLLDSNAGIALFGSDDKATIETLITYIKTLMKQTQDTAFSQLPVKDTLAAAIIIRDFHRTHIDRLQKTHSFTRDALNTRIRDINDNFKDNLGYDARNNRTDATLALEACTLEREVGFIVDAVNNSFHHVDTHALTTLLNDLAVNTSALYAEKGIMESHAAQDELFAMDDVISASTIPVDDNDTKAQLMILRMENKHREGKDRHVVVRQHWESSRKALKKGMLAAMPTIERMGFNLALAQDDGECVSSDPIAFSGVDIERTCTPSFHTRLSLANMVYDKAEQGNSVMNVLTGAIIAQIGCFIEMKKTRLLQLQLTALAQQVVTTQNMTQMQACELVSDRVGAISTLEVK